MRDKPATESRRGGTGEPTMNFLTRSVPWETWQFGLLKIAMISVGILLGVYFTEFLKALLPGIWVVAVVTSVWVTAIWFQAIKQASPP
jgi:hypothetical protein